MVGSLLSRMEKVEASLGDVLIPSQSLDDVRIVDGFGGFLARAVYSRIHPRKLYAHADRFKSSQDTERADIQTLLEAAGVVSRESAFVLLFWQHSRVRLRLHELGLAHVCGVWCATTSFSLEPEEMSRFALFWFGKLCEELPLVARLPSAGAAPVENPDLISSFDVHLFDSEGMLCQPREGADPSTKARRYPVVLPAREVVSQIGDSL